jgi:hypothetical protein
VACEQVVAECHAVEESLVVDLLVWAMLKPLECEAKTL